MKFLRFLYDKLKEESSAFADDGNSSGLPFPPALQTDIYLLCVTPLFSLGVTEQVDVYCHSF